MEEEIQALRAAVKRGDGEQVDALLAREPGLLEAAGPAVVLLACYYGQAELARRLVERGAPLDMFAAAAAGSLETVRRLAAEQPEQVNAFAGDGFQPLGLAAFFGHAGIVDFLLAHGAQANTASRNPMRVTPLHSAAARGDVGIVRRLLEQGADPNAVQADHFTPLHAAAQNGQADMIRLLLDYGAEINARQAGGKTAVGIAREAGQDEAARLLEQAGGTA